jgi:hypothetical protein
VLRPDGRGGDARFRVLDEDGRELEAGQLRSPLPVRLSLPPGTFRLVVSGEPGVPPLETTFVATGEIVVVPVRL